MDGYNIGLLLIGNELLDGYIKDINGYYLANELKQRGYWLNKIIVAKDNIEDISASLDFFKINSYDFVFVSGGLGPTDDDLTTEAIISWTKQEEIFLEECWNKIVARYKKRYLNVPQRNKKQAIIPAQFSMIENNYGTACGYIGEQEGLTVAVFPGVPTEFAFMSKKIIDKYFPVKKKKYEKIIRIFGISESQLNDLIKQIEDNYNIYLSFLPHFPFIRLRIFAENLSETEINNLDDDLRRILGDYVFSWRDKDIGEEIKSLFIKNQLKFSVAESCTGGLISEMLTAVPGSSQYFDRGFVTYTNKSKEELLGVNSETLLKYGAVSEETAKEMVEGVLEFSDGDIAVSVTGIAGPEGGTEEKPVGTVFIGIGDRSSRVNIRKNNFWGNREQVRNFSATSALFMVLKWIEKYY